MNRSTAIAFVGIASAMIIASTAGAVSLIQLRTTDGVEREGRLVVAAQRPTPLPVPDFSPAPLPALPKSKPQKQAERPGKTESRPPAQPAVAKDPTANTAPTITAEQAGALALAAAGGKVMKVVQTQRQGIVCWAVTLERTDGSIVLAVVEMKSGVIFGWELVEPAPAEVSDPDQGNNPAPGNGNGGDDEHDEDEDDEDEDEGNEDEGENDDD